MALASQPHAGFQPPAYIASLIASINDGARAAQTGGLFMLAIAVYLMATVISTTDEVLLRGTFVNFSQIGVQVPVVASYALAPLVFLFLYVHTLIRYDMLAENLRLLGRELRTALPIEADRDRCRQLLANVEFVQYWIAPKGSPWHSQVYPVLVWVMLVAIPIVVFLATQISFLRYQNAFVTDVIHRGSLAAALSAITYFWYRQARRRQDWQPLGWWGKARTLARSATGWFAAVVLLLAMAYLRIPPPYISASATLADRLSNFHPLDLIACPNFDWGCRYLRLDHRLLAQEKPEGEVLFKLRTGEDDLKNLLLRVEALFLRGRSFRFADFSNSEFYDADLTGVDLRGANLSGARLQGANLFGAQLQGADLSGAQLQGAGLSGAQLQGADLRDAQLQGAILLGAQLQGADLRGAALWQDQVDENSNLSLADLRGLQLRPVSAEKLAEILRSLDGIPEDRRQKAVERVTKALTPALLPSSPPMVLIEAGRPALVDAEQPGFDEKPGFAAFGVGLTTADEKVYDTALAPFLADLARSDADVARGIARRALSSQPLSDTPEAKRRLWPDLAQRLLAAEKEGAVKLDLSPDERKALEDLAAKAPPPPPVEGAR